MMVGGTGRPAPTFTEPPIEVADHVYEKTRDVSEQEARLFAKLEART